MYADCELVLAVNDKYHLYNYATCFRSIVYVISSHVLKLEDQFYFNFLSDMPNTYQYKHDEKCRIGDRSSL